MPSVAPLAPLRAVFAALLIAAGLFLAGRAVLAADPAPAAAPLSAADIRELELTKALVQAMALSDRGADSRWLAQLLLSTERHFKRKRESFISTLDAFRVVNARCEALEEAAANARERLIQDPDCNKERRQAAERVAAFPEQEPVYLNAMDTARKRYGNCESQKKQAAANATKKAAYDQCLTELGAMVDRIRDTYPNLEWVQQAKR